MAANLVKALMANATDTAATLVSIIARVYIKNLSALSWRPE